jgi:hypothetical protein
MKPEIGKIYVEYSYLHFKDALPLIEFWVYAGTIEDDGRTMHLFQDPKKYHWESIYNALPEEYQKESDQPEFRGDMIMAEDALGSMRDIWYMETFIKNLQKHDNFEKYFGTKPKSSNQAL